MRPFIETIGKCTTAYVLCYPNAGVYFKGLHRGKPRYMDMRGRVTDLDERVHFVGLVYS